jgi:WW domain-containing oxidoreductase
LDRITYSLFFIFFSPYSLQIFELTNQLLFANRQSSEFHRIGTSGVHFRDLAELNRDIGPSSLYGRSKLAQVLLVQALVRRKARGELGLEAAVAATAVAGQQQQQHQAPWINATHPGAVVTDQQEQAIEAYGKAGKLGVKAVRPFMKDPLDEGCRSALFAATSDDVVAEALDGAYIVPDRKVTGISKQAQDEELQERCWSLVESILREKLASVRSS